MVPRERPKAGNERRKTRDPLNTDLVDFLVRCLRHRMAQKAFSIIACSILLTVAVVHVGIYYTPISDVIAYSVIYSFWLTSCLPWLIKNLTAKVLWLVIQVLFRLFAAEIGFMAWGAYRGHKNVLQRGLRMRPLFEPSMTWFADAGYNLRYGVLVATLVTSILAVLLDQQRPAAFFLRNSHKRCIKLNLGNSENKRPSHSTFIPPTTKVPKLEDAKVSQSNGTETESDETVHVIHCRSPHRSYISNIGGKKYITLPEPNTIYQRKRNGMHRQEQNLTGRVRPEEGWSTEDERGEDGLQSISLVTNPETEPCNCRRNRQKTSLLAERLELDAFPGESRTVSKGHEGSFKKTDAFEFGVSQKAEKKSVQHRRARKRQCENRSGNKKRLSRCRSRIDEYAQVDHDEVKGEGEDEEAKEEEGCLGSLAVESFSAKQHIAKKVSSQQSKHVVNPRRRSLSAQRIPPPPHSQLSKNDLQGDCGAGVKASTAGKPRVESLFDRNLTFKSETTTSSRNKSPALPNSTRSRPLNKTGKVRVSFAGRQNDLSTNACNSNDQEGSISTISMQTFEIASPDASTTRPSCLV